MKVSLTPDGCGIDGILMRVAAIALHDDQIRRNAISLEELGGETGVSWRSVLPR